MSNFQLIVTGLFVAFLLVGVAVFALFGGVFGGSGIGVVTIWGTLPQQMGDYVLDSLSSTDKSLQDVRYVEKDAVTYQTDLLNAMASGASPDLFLVDQEQLGAFSDKIIPIPYSVVSQSAYLSQYIDEGTLFLTPTGTLALPFMVDPLVMYWNKDLFGSAGVAQPPQYWNDFLTLSPKMTSLDASQNVKKSAVALGQWSNVLHAKEILSTLFMQAGEFVTARTASGALTAVFGQNTSAAAGTPAESALRFYTEFSNPGKTTYSWNRSLPQSDEAFSSGIVAVYFGFASEYKELADRNPNLRFNVATMPQLQGGGNTLTYAKITGLAIPRSARNVQGAAVVAQKFSSAQAAKILATYTGLPSDRRDVPLDTAASAVGEAFVRSALMSRGWVDPDPTQTNVVFKDMIESVVSGRNEPASAVAEASQEFLRILPYTYSQ